MNRIRTSKLRLTAIQVQTWKIKQFHQQVLVISQIMHSIRAQTCCRLIYMVTATVKLTGSSRRCNHSNARCWYLIFWTCGQHRHSPRAQHGQAFRIKGSLSIQLRYLGGTGGMPCIFRAERRRMLEQNLVQSQSLQDTKKVLQQVFEHCRAHEREHSVQ